MAPPRSPDGIERRERGYVVPIGGAEDKENDPAILERFVELCGGEKARIVVVPTASRLREIGPRYVQLFEEIGAGGAVSVAIDSRADSNQASTVERLELATGIFLTGGNQLRLSTTLGGTRAAECICRLNRRGVHVAGTSAGAAILSDHMIAGGKNGATPTAQSVMLAPGLGLTGRLVIDQHFRQRDRLGRLLAAISFNPYLIGIGLDEDTALFLGPDHIFEVVGTGAVTVVDPSDLEQSTMGRAAVDEPVSLTGLKLHVLARGARYNTNTREATID